MRTYFKKTYNDGSMSIWFEANGFRYSFTNEDPANTEYKAYLAWVAEGNTATEWSPEA
jgi:hypothetical protein